VTHGDATTIAVLVNPLAGKGRPRRLRPEILARLSGTGRELRLLEPSSPAQAQVACDAAVADGVDALVAVGGDGTVHLALQAVAGRDVPFGVVPTGTGNDFADAVGLPADPLAAADTVAAALTAGRTRPLDLGRITTADGQHRWYCAVLAAGFDAIANERANRMRFPRGHLRYDLAIYAELLRLRPRRYTLRLDGTEHRVDSVLIAIGNTSSYGGGFLICPDADPTDGLLDVVVADAMSRTQLVRIKPLVRRGTHVAHRLVHTYRARTVELAGDNVIVYADGERAFPLPVTITCVPAAVRLLS
jgi:diacylglycerol kinase (ATP)